jgi:hypothetical protein
MSGRDLLTDERRLFEDLCTTAWLEAGFRRVKKNKGSPGVDGVTIAEFESRLDEELRQLKADLEGWTYKPSPVRRVEIPKPGGCGIRLLGVPTVRDRVVHATLKLLLEPIFEPLFSEHSYGFRPERNQGQAVEAARKLVAGGKPYVVDLDLSKFFDRIHHDRLIARVGRTIPDKRILRLVGMILRSGIMADGLVTPSTEGAVQGSPLSPLLSNIVLDELDKELERRGLEFCRFADDCAPRRRTGGRKPSVQPCCTRDGGRPPEAAVQAEASNRPLLLPSREVVVRELGKGRARPGQVRTVESNASKPLMKCRKRRDGVKTGGESLPRDQSGGNLSTAQAASGMKAARMRSRLLCGTWEPVTPMPREERKGKPPKRASTDAGYRDGATCSSDEGPVTGLERRGCPIRPEAMRQPAMGGPR